MIECIWMKVNQFGSISLFLVYNTLSQHNRNMAESIYKKRVIQQQSDEESDEDVPLVSQSD